ncbi:MAG: hypothetical protein ABIH50_04855 [bacterium]
MVKSAGLQNFNKGTRAEALKIKARQLLQRASLKTAGYAAAVVAPVGLLAGGPVESFVGGVGLIAEGYYLYTQLKKGAGSLASQAYSIPVVDFNKENVPGQLVKLKLALEAINDPNFTFPTSDEQLKALLTSLTDNYFALNNHKDRPNPAYNDNRADINACLILTIDFLADKYLAQADLAAISDNMDVLHNILLYNRETLDKLVEKLIDSNIYPQEKNALLTTYPILGKLLRATEIVAENKMTPGSLAEARQTLEALENNTAARNTATSLKLLAFVAELEKLLAPTKEAIENTDINSPDGNKVLSGILARLNGDDYIPAEDSFVMDVITALEGKKPQIEALPDSDQKTALLDSIKKFFVKTISLKPRPEYLLERLNEAAKNGWSPIISIIDEVISGLADEAIKQPLPEAPIQKKKIFKFLTDRELELEELETERELQTDEEAARNKIIELKIIIGERL